MNLWAIKPRFSASSDPVRIALLPTLCFRIDRGASFLQVRNEIQHFTTYSLVLGWWRWDIAFTVCNVGKRRQASPQERDQELAWYSAWERHSDKASDAVRPVARR